MGKRQRIVLTFQTSRDLIIGCAALSLALVMSLNYVNVKRVQKENFYSLKSMNPDESRRLSVDLGDGTCTLQEPTKKDLTTDISSAVLVAYPGTGKRLGWHILQALTGRVAGDDWDLSHNGVDVTTMKSSYPHKEGRWAWESKMDFSMLMVRNPYHTLQAYQNIRHELEYSVNWIKSFSRVKNVYTATSPVEEWIIWRDSLFEKELKAWGSFIEFWMNGGHLTGDPVDSHCEDDMVDCTPRLVIQYEKLLNSDTEEGRREFNKIGEVLGTNKFELVAAGAEPCIHQTILETPEDYELNREKFGPPDSAKSFTHFQIAEIIEEVQRLILLYENETSSVAVDLVAALDEYETDLGKEYAIESSAYTLIQGPLQIEISQ